MGSLLLFTLASLTLLALFTLATDLCELHELLDGHLLLDFLLENQLLPLLLDLGLAHLPGLQLHALLLSLSRFL